MAPNHLIADVAAARAQDLLVEAQQQRRLRLARPSHVIEVVVRASAPWIVPIRTSRAVTGSAAA